MLGGVSRLSTVGDNQDELSRSSLFPISDDAYCECLHGCLRVAPLGVSGSMTEQPRWVDAHCTLFTLCFLINVLVETVSAAKGFSTYSASGSDDRISGECDLCALSFYRFEWCPLGSWLYLESQLYKGVCLLPFGIGHGTARRRRFVLYSFMPLLLAHQGFGPLLLL